MSVDRNAPQIRFKGFSGEWAEKSLGETRAYYTDGNYGEAYPSNADLTDCSNGVPFLRGSNLSRGHLSKDGANYITEKKHAELTSGTLVEDDIVIAVRGSLGALGYVKKENVGWNINSQLAIIRTDKSEQAGLFLIQYLLSDIGQWKILSKISGSALKQLPIGQLKLITVPITSIKEQSQIGNYFQKLDNLINQHQQKHDKLSSIKKAMLEKMFPKQGETIPEVRFKGFGGEWGHLTIGDCSSLITKGTTPMTIGRNFVDRGVAFVKVESVDEIGNLNPRKFAYIDTETDQILARSRIKENDLLVSIAGALGRAAIVKKEILPANTNQALAIVRLKNDSPVEVEFLYHFTKTKDFKDFVDASASQGAQPNLSLGDISKVRILAPAKEEQIAIGNYFQKLDTLINQHQQQITKLKNIKQACLSKMFV